MHNLSSLCAPVAVEGPFVGPGRPDDSSEAIGKSDGGFVVSALTLAIECPSTQAVEAVSGALSAVRREQGRSSAVHQERS